MPWVKNRFGATVWVADPTDRSDPNVPKAAEEKPKTSTQTATQPKPKVRTNKYGGPKGTKKDAEGRSYSVHQGKNAQQRASDKNLSAKQRRALKSQEDAAARAAEEARHARLSKKLEKRAARVNKRSAEALKRIDEKRQARLGRISQYKKDIEAAKAAGDWNTIRKLGSRISNETSGLVELERKDLEIAGKTKRRKGYDDLAEKQAVNRAISAYSGAPVGDPDGVLSAQERFARYKSEAAAGVGANYRPAKRVKVGESGFAKQTRNQLIDEIAYQTRNPQLWDTPEGENASSQALDRYHDVIAKHSEVVTAEYVNQQSKGVRLGKQVDRLAAKAKESKDEKDWARVDKAITKYMAWRKQPALKRLIAEHKALHGTETKRKADGTVIKHGRPGLMETYYLGTERVVREVQNRQNALQYGNGLTGALRRIKDLPAKMQNSLLALRIENNRKEVTDAVTGEKRMQTFDEALAEFVASEYGDVDPEAMMEQGAEAPVALDALAQQFRDTPAFPEFMAELDSWTNRLYPDQPDRVWTTTDLDRPEFEQAIRQTLVGNAAKKYVQRLVDEGEIAAYSDGPTYDMRNYHFVKQQDGSLEYFYTLPSGEVLRHGDEQDGVSPQWSQFIEYAQFDGHFASVGVETESQRALTFNQAIRLDAQRAIETEYRMKAEKAVYDALGQKPPDAIESFFRYNVAGQTLKMLDATGGFLAHLVTEDQNGILGLGAGIDTTAFERDDPEGQARALTESWKQSKEYRFHGDETGVFDPDNYGVDGEGQYFIQPGTTLKMRPGDSIYVSAAQSIDPHWTHTVRQDIPVWERLFGGGGTGGAVIGGGGTLEERERTERAMYEDEMYREFLKRTKSFSFEQKLGDEWETLYVGKGWDKPDWNPEWGEMPDSYNRSAGPLANDFTEKWSDPLDGVIALMGGQREWVIARRKSDDVITTMRAYSAHGATFWVSTDEGVAISEQIEEQGDYLRRLLSTGDIAIAGSVLGEVDLVHYGNLSELVNEFWLFFADPTNFFPAVAVFKRSRQGMSAVRKAAGSGAWSGHGPLKKMAAGAADFARGFGTHPDQHAFRTGINKTVSQMTGMTEDQVDVMLMRKVGGIDKVTPNNYRKLVDDLVAGIEKDVGIGNMRVSREQLHNWFETHLVDVLIDRRYSVDTQVKQLRRERLQAEANSRANSADKVKVRQEQERRIVHAEKMHKAAAKHAAKRARRRARIEASKVRRTQRRTAKGKATIERQRLVDRMARHKASREAAEGTVEATETAKRTPTPPPARKAPERPLADIEEARAKALARDEVTATRGPQRTMRGEPIAEPKGQKVILDRVRVLADNIRERRRKLAGEHTDEYYDNALREIDEFEEEVRYLNDLYELAKTDYRKMRAAMVRFESAYGTGDKAVKRKGEIEQANFAGFSERYLGRKEWAVKSNEEVEDVLNGMADMLERSTRARDKRVREVLERRQHGRLNVEEHTRLLADEERELAQMLAVADASLGANIRRINAKYSGHRYQRFLKELDARGIEQDVVMRWGGVRTRQMRTITQRRDASVAKAKAVEEEVPRTEWDEAYGAYPASGSKTPAIARKEQDIAFKQRQSMGRGGDPAAHEQWDDSFLTDVDTFPPGSKVAQEPEIALAREVAKGTDPVKARAAMDYLADQAELEWGRFWRMSDENPVYPAHYDGKMAGLRTARDKRNYIAQSKAVFETQRLAHQGALNDSFNIVYRADHKGVVIEVQYKRDAELAGFDGSDAGARYVEQRLIEEGYQLGSGRWEKRYRKDASGKVVESDVWVRDSERPGRSLSMGEDARWYEDRGTGRVQGEEYYRPFTAYNSRDGFVAYPETSQMYNFRIDVLKQYLDVKEFPRIAFRQLLMDAGQAAKDDGLEFGIGAFKQRNQWLYDFFGELDIAGRDDLLEQFHDEVINMIGEVDGIDDLLASWLLMEVRSGKEFAMAPGVVHGVFTDAVAPMGVLDYPARQMFGHRYGVYVEASHGKRRVFKPAVHQVGRQDQLSPSISRLANKGVGGRKGDKGYLSWMTQVPQTWLVRFTRPLKGGKRSNPIQGKVANVEYGKSYPVGYHEVYDELYAAPDMSLGDVSRKFIALMEASNYHHGRWFFGAHEQGRTSMLRVEMNERGLVGFFDKRVKFTKDGKPVYANDVARTQVENLFLNYHLASGGSDRVFVGIDAETGKYLYRLDDLEEGTEARAYSPSDVSLLHDRGVLRDADIPPDFEDFMARVWQTKSTIADAGDSYRIDPRTNPLGRNKPGQTFRRRRVVTKVARTGQPGERTRIVLEPDGGKAFGSYSDIGKKQSRPGQNQGARTPLAQAYEYGIGQRGARSGYKPIPPDNPREATAQYLADAQYWAHTGGASTNITGANRYLRAIEAFALRAEKAGDVAQAKMLREQSRRLVYDMFGGQMDGVWHSAVNLAEGAGGKQRIEWLFTPRGNPDADSAQLFLRLRGMDKDDVYRGARKEAIARGKNKERQGYVGQKQYAHGDNEVQIRNYERDTDQQLAMRKKEADRYVERSKVAEQDPYVEEAILEWGHINEGENIGEGEAGYATMKLRAERLANEVIRRLTPGSETGLQEMDRVELVELAEEMAGSSFFGEGMQKALLRGRPPKTTPKELKNARQAKAAKAAADHAKAVDKAANAEVDRVVREAMEEANRSGKGASPDYLKGVGDDARTRYYAEQRKRDAALKNESGEKQVGEYDWTIADAKDPARKEAAHARLADELGVETPTYDKRGHTSMLIGDSMGESVEFLHQGQLFREARLMVGGMRSRGVALSDKELGRILWAIYNDVEFMKGLRVAELQGVRRIDRSMALRDEVLQRAADMSGKRIVIDKGRKSFVPRDPKDLRELANAQRSTPPLGKNEPVRPAEPPPPDVDVVAPGEEVPLPPETQMADPSPIDEIVDVSGEGMADPPPLRAHKEKVSIWQTLGMTEENWYWHQVRRNRAEMGRKGTSKQRKAQLRRENKEYVLAVSHLRYQQGRHFKRRNYRTYKEASRLAEQVSEEVMGILPPRTMASFAHDVLAAGTEAARGLMVKMRNSTFVSGGLPERIMAKFDPKHYDAMNEYVRTEVRGVYGSRDRSLDLGGHYEADKEFEGVMQTRLDRDPKIREAVQRGLDKYAADHNIEAWDIQLYARTRQLVGREHTRMLRTTAMLDTVGGDMEQFLALRSAAADAEAVKQVRQLLLDNPHMTPEEATQYFIMDRRRDGRLQTSTWDLTQTDQQILEGMFQHWSGAKSMDKDEVRRALQANETAPPMDSKFDFREHQLAIGEWSPRAVDEVAQGGSWSMKDEAKWWEDRYGEKPAWLTHPKIEDGSFLDDLETYVQVMQEVGQFSDRLRLDRVLGEQKHIDFDLLSEGQKAADGTWIVRPRSDVAMERKFLIERYGHLVSKDGINLDRAPWLMTPEELKSFRRMDGGPVDGLIHLPEEVKAVQEVIEDMVESMADEFDKAYRINPGTPLKVDSAAIHKAVYPAVQQVIATTAWKGASKYIQNENMLNLWTAFWRGAIMAHPGFVVSNVLDTPSKALVFGWSEKYAKAVDQRSMEAIPFLAATGLDDGTAYFTGHGGRDPWTRLKNPYNATDAMGAVFDVVTTGFSRFTLTRVEKHSKLRIARQLYAGIWDEFADDFLNGVKSANNPRGAKVSETQMDLLVKLQVKERVNKLFPTLDDAGEAERLLNRVFPFISYFAKNTMLWTGFFLDHPYLIHLVERLQEHYGNYNADQWRKRHGDIPMPEYMRHQFIIPGTDFGVDFGQFTDIARGGYLAFNEDVTIGEFVSRFARPLPTQTALFLRYVYETTGHGGRVSWRKVLDENGHWDGVSTEQYITAPHVPWGDRSLEGYDLLGPVGDLWEIVNGTAAEGRLETNPAALRIFGDLMQFGQFSEPSTFYMLSQEYRLIGETLGEEAQRAWLDTPTGLELQEMWDQRFWDPNEPNMPAGQGHNLSSLTLKHLRGELVTNKDIANAFLVNQPPDVKNGVFESWDKMRVMGDSWDDILDSLDYGDEAGREHAWNMRETMMTTLYHENPYLYLYETIVDGKDLNESVLQWKLDGIRGTFFDLFGWETRPSNPDELKVWEQRRADYLKAYPELAQSFADEYSGYQKALNDQEQAYEASFKAFETAEKVKDVAREIERWDLYDAASAQADLASMVFETEVAGYDREGNIKYKADRRIRRLLGGDAEGVVYDERMSGAFREAKDKDGRIDMWKWWQTVDKDPTLREPYFAANPEAAIHWKVDGQIHRLKHRFGIHAAAERWDKAWELFDEAPAHIRERWREENPAQFKRWERNSRYSAFMGTWVSYFDRGDSKGAMEYFNSLPKWVRDKYYENNPGKQLSSGRSSAYVQMLDQMFGQIDAGNWDAAERIWNAAPYWMRSQYYTNNPDSTLFRGGKGGSGGSYRPTGGPSLSDPQFKQYVKMMGKWVDLQKQGKDKAAAAYFRKLPEWAKAFYLARNPDKRLLREDDRMYTLLQDYFTMDNEEKADWLDKHPEVARWLNENDTKRARQDAIRFIFQELPDDPWLKRVYKEKYPEVFGDEAVGQGRIDQVMEILDGAPSLQQPWLKWYRHIARTMEEALKYSEKKPKLVERDYTAQREWSRGLSADEVARRQRGAFERTPITVKRQARTV